MGERLSLPKWDREATNCIRLNPNHSAMPSAASWAASSARGEVTQGPRLARAAARHQPGAAGGAGALPGAQGAPVGPPTVVFGPSSTMWTLELLGLSAFFTFVPTPCDLTVTANTKMQKILVGLKNEGYSSSEHE